MPVIMASSMTYQGAETTIKALTIGAAECIAKPVAKNAADSIAQLSQKLLRFGQGVDPTQRDAGGIGKTPRSRRTDDRGCAASRCHRRQYGRSQGAFGSWLPDCRPTLNCRF